MKALFKAEGFRRHGSVQVWEAPEVVVVIGFTSSYDQLFFDVGFWLTSLSKNPEQKVEKFHIYGRLEDAFPELRPEIIDAGDCKNPNYQTFVEAFRRHLSDSIAPGLKRIATESALVEMLLSEKLTRFLIVPAVREYLKSRVS